MIIFTVKYWTLFIRIIRLLFNFITWIRIGRKKKKTTNAATNKAMHNVILDEEKKNTESDKLNGDK